MPSKQIAIAVVEHPISGEFLVGVRPDGVPLAGYDEFPGGKVKAGESFEDAAIRECLEETGLCVTVVGEYPPANHAYEHGTLHLRFFRCVVHTEHAEVTPKGTFRWLDRSSLTGCLFPEANAELLHYLLAR